MNSLQPLKHHAMRLLNENRLAEARNMCLEAHKMEPADGEILHLLSIIHARQSDFQSAEQWAKKAVEALPGNAQVRMLLANLYVMQNRPAEAKQHYEIILSDDPQFSEAHYYLASILAMEGNVGEAEIHFRHSVRLQPAHADSHANLGMIFEVQHKLTDARDEVNAALAINPNHTGALLLLAKLEKRGKNYATAETLLRRVLTPGAHPSLVATVSIEHGHVLDKLGQYDKAFEAFSLGKSAWSHLAANAPFDKQEYQKRIGKYREWITENTVKQWHPESSRRAEYRSPIFFVGFPRSGTTLMEQILSQQAGFVTTDEKPLIQSVIDKIPDLFPASTGFPQCLSGMSEQNLARLRDEYWSLAERSVGHLSHGARLVDKFPLNLVELGFIHRIFPNARILVAIRDPRDVCISCFMQGFGLNPAMINFLDLESTTEFYSQVMSLWLHYRSVLPMRWHEYRYEDLIENFEQTTRGIAEFLDVEWSEKMKDYYVGAQERYISTPSYQDVASPIYKLSVARWKNYARHLSPFIEKLTPFLKEFDYQ